MICKLQHHDESIDAIMPASTVEALANMGLKDLTKVFHAVLGTVASQRQPVVIFLDALDQLQNDENGRTELLWLPSRLPRFVGVIVSTLPHVGGCFDALVRRGFAHRSVLPCRAQGDTPVRRVMPVVSATTSDATESATDVQTALLRASPSVAKTLFVPRMEESEIEGVLSSLFYAVHRTLTPTQREVVVQSIMQCTLPLYIQLCFGACRWWKSSDVSHCELFPSTVQVLYLCESLS